MDPLDKLTDHSRNLAKAARRAFMEGHPETCKTFLSELSHYLSEESIEDVYAKCESADRTDG